MEGLPEDLKSPGKGPCLNGEASPVELIVRVVTRLSYGCPLQAIVHAYDRDSRTVAMATLAAYRLLAEKYIDMS
jgi:hypothetical protein